MQLEPTSERVVEEFYTRSAGEYLIYLFHKVTYNFALPYVTGKQVLDYGCGSGYGTHHVAPRCAHIVGIDISQDAIDYAQQRYKADNLTFQVTRPAEEAPLPFKDGSFDVVLSFQVIEHVYDSEAYLSEIRRVLRPGGVFICATPDRVSRLFPGQKPWNMWHVREFDGQGLARIIKSHFTDVTMLNMGGKKGVLSRELRRTKRLKWAMLPITLPFVPDIVRVKCLSFIKRTAAALKSKAEWSMQNLPYQESDLIIEENIYPSVNLIAVAKTDPGEPSTRSSL